MSVDPKDIDGTEAADGAGTVADISGAASAGGAAGGVDDRGGPAVGSAAAGQRGSIDDAAEGEGGGKQTLESRLAASDKEKKENWDRYLRAAADLENLRKRQKREVDEAKTDAKGKVLKEMLPVVDNLERAIEHATTQAGTNPIVEGVQLVLRQFMSAFEKLDVVPVEAANQPFDPNLHEAISQQDSDQPPGTIVTVLQRGYRSGERLLRPALVIVAKAPTRSE